MRPFCLALSIVLTTCLSASAQKPIPPHTNEDHAAALRLLHKDPGAARSYSVDETGNVISLRLCGHLSPQQIEAVKSIKSLKTLFIGGGLPRGCCSSPSEVTVAAEKHRHDSLPLALPQLADLTVKMLILGHAPSKEEIDVITSRTQLEFLSGPIKSHDYQRLSSLTNLRTLTLTGNLPPEVSPEFLRPLTKLESLSLPPMFKDDTLAVLSKHTQLKTLTAPGCTGEAIVDYMMDVRGASFYDAMRCAGYHINRDENGRPYKLYLTYTDDFKRLYSRKVLDQLTDLREVSFTHICDMEDEVLGVLVGKRVETVTVTGMRMDPSLVAELCAIDSIKHLHVSFSAAKTTVPKISGSKNLESLSLGGINDFKTKITELRDLPKLVDLKVYSAQIGVEEANQLKQLARLKRLTLRGGTLTRDAVQVISTMTNLEYLNLSKTNVGDDELALLTSLKKLKTLETRDSQVSVNALARFQRNHLGLGPMKILQAAGVSCRRENSKRITDVTFKKKCGVELLRSMEELPAVTRVKFMMTPLTSDDLLPLYDMETVTDVEFIYSKTVDSKIIDGLAEMPNLKRVTFSNTGLTDESKDSLLKLRKLESVELRERGMSPAVKLDLNREMKGVLQR